MRKIPRRFRWLLIESYSGNPTVGLDPDETVSCGAWFKRPLDKLTPTDRYLTSWRVVRRSDWLKEHS